MGDSPNEQQLWQDFQAGDEEAYTTIYRFHVKAMFRYGMSLIPVSEAFVFDCIHDVFTELWIKRGRLSLPDNTRHYLLKSLKIRILHLLNRQERPLKALSEEDFDDLSSEPSFEEILTLKEESESREALVARLIAQLPYRQQEAVRLRYVENMDYGQIASILEVNRQSAQNLVHRAVEKLRQWLIS
jgi:RNA polymerase sigma factor (sigma-70 family)